MVMVGELLCVIPVQEVVSGDVVFPFRARVSKANFSGFCLSICQLRAEGELAMICFPSLIILPGNRDEAAIEAD